MTIFETFQGNTSYQSWNQWVNNKKLSIKLKKALLSLS